MPVALLIVLYLFSELNLPFLSALSGFFFYIGVIFIILWTVKKAFQVFLWRVSRRLAFSYFLIGVLPVPMVISLLLIGGYFICGMYLGSHYRSTVHELYNELNMTAKAYQTGFVQGAEMPVETTDGLAFAYYSGGKKVSGDVHSPDSPPEWLIDRVKEYDTSGETPYSQCAYVILDGIGLSLAAYAGDAENGTLAYYKENFQDKAIDRSNIWIDYIFSSKESPGDMDITFSIEKGGISVRPDRSGQLNREDQGRLRSEFFKTDNKDSMLWDRPVIYWGETMESIIDLKTGIAAPFNVFTVLNSAPRMIYENLYSTSSEFDRLILLLFNIQGIVLMVIYLTAVFLAFYMIFGLSRAVNRLSRTTKAVQSGDFSARIKVKRRDQIGYLQKSFNKMTENLESLVAAEAQKELLEKELELARSLQKSLLPRETPGGETVEFVTVFEPSAAIGGDYFDILNLEDDRLAVVIADVAGHGLPAGLRMAMLKAGLFILMEEGHEIVDILQRLDKMIRMDVKDRTFVTLTLALFDYKTGELNITNAAHPPTYLIRKGKVDEIMLPSSPIGAVGRTFASKTMKLEPGDIAVWLSDGFIEARNEHDEPFGYDRIIEALSHHNSSPHEVRLQLLNAVQTYTGHRALEDDITLVIMSYNPEK